MPRLRALQNRYQGFPIYAAQPEASRFADDATAARSSSAQVEMRDTCEMPPVGFAKELPISSFLGA